MTHVPDVDFALDTYHLVLLWAGPKADELDAATVERLQGHHIADNLAQLAAGQLLVAGATVDAPASGADPADADALAGRALVGLGVYPGGDADAVRALVEQDPGIADGLYAYTLHTFLTPAGGLTFPLSGHPLPG